MGECGGVFPGNQHFTFLYAAIGSILGALATFRSKFGLARGVNPSGRLRLHVSRALSCSCPEGKGCAEAESVHQENLMA